MNNASQTLPPPSWRSFAKSHVGAVRTLNEDSYLEMPEIGLWAVADGMGGHSAGDVASQMAVEALAAIPLADLEDNHYNAIQKAMSETNQRLIELSQNSFNGAIVGTTVVAMFIYNQTCTFMWAGDSRGYLYRDNKLTQITRDHSQVEEMVACGLLTKEEAEHHPQGNVITRAVGANEELELESITYRTEPGDIYLLCTDGLNNELTDKEIEELIASGDVAETNRALIHAAVVREASDNITSVLVQLGGIPKNIIL